MIDIKNILGFLKKGNKYESPLRAILCGFERGGTTLISEVLRQHPNIDSGFEVGFLLANNPKDFSSIQPFNQMLKKGWKITDEDVTYICSADSWEDMYNRLKDRAGNIKSKNVCLIDKTPAYMKDLSVVMDKMPNIPCVVVVRDPRAMLWSWQKRAESGSIEDHYKQYIARYNSYAKGLRGAMENEKHKNKILVVQFEKISLSPNDEFKKIFSFLNLSFRDSYITFKPKFGNVRGESVDPKYIYEYKENIPKEICNLIVEGTKDFREFHWNM